MPLFATKFHKPALRPDALRRVRLLGKLNSAYPLTLLSAPAGFGKTTLVSAWSQQAAVPVAWLALETEDNEFHRFLTYLIAALRTVGPAQLGEDVLALLQAPQPLPPASLFATLAHELNTTLPPCILVLDDYHVISAQAIHDLIAFLLEHAPTLRWIITTRADPPLPLGRLRARGQLCELRSIDLRFTLAEITQLLNETMQLALSTEAVQELETRTEGWVAGLQLAALAMQHASERTQFVQHFSGSHRYIVDYLTDEVLNQLPEQTQTFLLQTSILERLCAELCDAVIEDQRLEIRDSSSSQSPISKLQAPVSNLRSQGMLEELERANLFLIPLDDERRWYRYHHLFADLLKQRLHRRQPDMERVLHQRAATWFAQQHLLEEAFRHATLAQDYAHAIQLIEAHALFLAFNAQAALLQTWLNTLPVALRQSTPRLCLAQVWAGISLGNMITVETVLQTAEQLYAQQPALHSTELQTEIAIAHTMIASATLDIERALRYGQLALAHLPKTELHQRLFIAWGLGHAQMWSGQIGAAEQTLTAALRDAPDEPSFLIAKVTLLGTFGLLRCIQGRFKQGQQVYRQAVEMTTRAGRPLPGIGVGLVHLELGQRLLEENRLDEAEHYFQQAVTLAQLVDNNIIQAYTLSNLALIAYARGEHAQVWDYVARADQVAAQFAVPAFLIIDLHRVFLWLKYDNLQAAEAWSTTYAAALREQGPLTFLDLGHLTLARVWIYSKRYAEALALLTRLLAEAQATGQGLFIYWALILQATALHGQGELDQAKATLLEALKLTEPEGVIRMFVGEGEAIKSLLSALRTTISDVRLRAYVEQILDAFGQPESDRLAQFALHTSPPATSPAPLIEPLSDREREILQLMAAGLSNQAIADRLVITLGTVKSHANHIFSKLGVQGRVQAINLAREKDLF